MDKFQSLYNIKVYVETNRHLLKSAVVGLVFSGNSCHYGFIEYIGKKEPSPQPFFYDYSSFLLLRKELTIDEATELLVHLRDHEEIRGIPPITRNFRLSQARNPVHRIGSKDTTHSSPLKGYSHNRWPMWYLRSQISYSSLPKPTPTGGYLSGTDLPYFPSIDDAIDSLFGVPEERFISRRGEEFEVLLPDYRGRIESLVLLEKEMKVKIESGLSKLPSMNCKIFMKGKKTSHYSEQEVKRRSVNFSFPEMPIRLHILLTNSENQELDLVTFDFRDPIPSWITRKYSEGEIESLLDLGESLNIEYKADIPRGNHKEFLESVSAFANTDGGKILVGVDNNANIIGWRKNQNQRIQDLISAYIEPDVSFTISNTTIEEKEVTIVDVLEGKDKPYVLKDHGPFKRVGATDKAFSRLDWERMKLIHIDFDPDQFEYYR